jgi:hypothetical protein
MILGELRERIKKGEKKEVTTGDKNLPFSRNKKGFPKGKSGLYTNLRVTQVHKSDVGSYRILSDPIIRQNPIGFLVTESHWNPTVGSSANSDGIRLSELMFVFVWLSDFDEICIRTL